MPPTSRMSAYLINICYYNWLIVVFIYFISLALAFIFFFSLSIYFYNSAILLSFRDSWLYFISYCNLMIVLSFCFTLYSNSLIITYNLPLPGKKFFFCKSALYFSNFWTNPWYFYFWAFSSLIYASISPTIWSICISPIIWSICISPIIWSAFLNRIWLASFSKFLFVSSDSL